MVRLRRERKLQQDIQVLVDEYVESTGYAPIVKMEGYYVFPVQKGEKTR